MGVPRAAPECLPELKAGCARRGSGAPFRVLTAWLRPFRHRTLRPGVTGSPAAPGSAPADQAATPAPPQQAAVAPAPAVPEKPVAGPVVPLTRPETAPGGTLMSTAPRLEGAAPVQKTLREGVAPTPRPGRADDFRWPKS